MRIMVLDDNPDAAMVLENFLKSLGHKVSSFTDGREALLWLNDIKPQVIIADLDMPEIDGYDFLKRIRASTTYGNTPVICFTGTNISEEEISSGGFAAVIRKPSTLSDIMVAIDDVASSHKLSEC